MLNGIATGNVGADAELRYLPDGSPVLNFSIGSNEKVKGVEKTTWIRCAIFGKRGEALAPHITKGSALTAIGPITIRDFESNGEKRYSIEMKVDQLAFGGGGAGKGGAPKGESSGGYTRPAARAAGARNPDAEPAGADDFNPDDF